MNINNNITHLVEKMILCHDNGDFDTLVTLLAKNSNKDKESFLTRDLFNEVSDKIHKQLGYFESIEYLGKLNKKNSIHTIWKTTYSETNDETLWQVYINDHCCPVNLNQVLCKCKL